jgi:hypothetical protein
MKRTVFTLLFCLAIGTCLGAAQGSESEDTGSSTPGKERIHYVLTGESKGVEVTINLDKFIIEWFEKDVANFDQLCQTEKDDLARKLLADQSLDYIDLRLANKAGRTLMMNIMGDTLAVCFKKERAEYRCDIENTNYPSRLSENAQIEARFPIALTTDEKMDIGRLAASLTRIDYLIRRALRSGDTSNLPQAQEDAREWADARMAPIAKSILEQDLFGQFYISEEKLSIPLVFRISLAVEKEMQ